MADKDQQPLYFWRETDPTTGWLSQWYYCPFRDDEDESIVYDTAEHYMMYQKALLFNDALVAARVLTAAQHPRAIKALGRKVAGFNEETWAAHREDIVRRGNVLKFTRAVSELPTGGEGGGGGGGATGGDGSKKNDKKKRTAAGKRDALEGSNGSTLKEILLATGEREIVEASPYDAIWGIGFTERDAEGMRDHWGLNLLGKALMEVRDELREHE